MALEVFYVVGRDKVKTMRLTKLILVLAVLWPGVAVAQWQVPTNSIPYGKGSGKIGFGSITNGGTGTKCLTDTVPPTFQTCGGGGGSGTVTSIVAGTGLSGGTITGAGTLAVLYGTSSTTAAAGNDSRITGALQASNNLSEIVSATAARTNLGLGTMATQAASAVAISGGTIAGTPISGSTGSFSTLAASTSVSLTNNQAATTRLSVTNTDAAGASSIFLTGAAGTGTNLQHNAAGNGTLITTSPALFIDALNAAGQIVLRTGVGPTARFSVGAAGAVTVNSLAGTSGCVVNDSAGVISSTSCVASSLPTGGAKGDALLKNSTSNGDVSFLNPGCTSASSYGFIDPTGGTDYTTQLAAVFTDINAGTLTCIEWPAGIWLVNTCSTAGSYVATLSANRRLVFRGQGIGQTTFKFACTSGTNAFTFTFTGTERPYNGNSVSVGGFDLMTTKAGAGAGAAITLNGNTAVGNASIPTTFRDINIINDGAATTGWDQGFVITDASQVHFDNVTGASCNSAGTPCYRGTFIKLVSTTAAAMTGIIIRHADAQFFNEGITASRTGSGRMEGLFISDTNLSFMQYGIDINIPGTDGQITGSQLNAVVGAITITGMDGGSITGGTQICDPAPAAAGTGNCVYINAQRWALQGANVAPALTLPNIKYNGVVLGPLAQLNSISGSKITNPDTGIWFQASSTLNKAFLNHVVNANFSVGVNSGSSSYMTCNSVDSSANGSSAACP